jgi:hypothetical protein
MGALLGIGCQRFGSLGATRWQKGANSKGILEEMAGVAFWLLYEAEGLSPETRKRLEKIRDTDPEWREAEVT